MFEIGVYMYNALFGVVIEGDVEWVIIGKVGRIEGTVWM